MILGAGAVAAVALIAASSAAAYRYPAVFRTTFLHACVSGGAPQATCVCAINYVEARVPLRRFEKQILNYENGGPLPRIELRAIHACVGA